jgi:soluble lytic murein transglycosylase
VDEWIETYGDPRDSLVDQVNWIEHIPYRETRNYVMRVMESLHVYRARITGKTAPLQLQRDLNRG